MRQPLKDQNISNGISTSASSLTGNTLKTEVLPINQRKPLRSNIQKSMGKSDEQDHPVGDQSGSATLVQSDIEVQIAKTIDEINEILRTLVPIAAQALADSNVSKTGIAQISAENTNISADTEVLSELREKVIASDRTEATSRDQNQAGVASFMHIPRFSGNTTDWKKDRNRTAAKLASILPALRRNGDPQVIANARTAAEHLKADAPNLGLAADIIEELTFKQANNRMPASLYLMIGSALYTCVALGAIYAISISFLPTAPSRYEAWEKVFTATNVPPWMVLVIALAGGLGAVASIGTRFGEFNASRGQDQWDLLLHGLTRPFIGVILSGFVIVALLAKMIPLEIAQGTHKLYFLFAIAFVTGFSERFFRDMLARVEGGRTQTATNGASR